MRLKYYLRGIGVGVIITTILFMILISVSRNDAPQQNLNQDGESKTVADLENNGQTGADMEAEQGGQQGDAQGADEPEENQKTDEPGTQPEDGQKADEPDAQPEGGQKADEPDAQPEGEPAGQPADNQPPDTQPEEDQKVGKVRFIISGGEYSDVICQKLKEAGLIDDADAYNKFLVEENYDNFINPGVYDIPKNATYEEIAVLLTTKVE